MPSVSRSAQNSLFLTFLALISDISASLTTSSLEKPTPVLVTPSFVSDVTKNTHTSIVGRNGQTTSVPIIGGAECWFCPASEDEANDIWEQLLEIDLGTPEDEANNTQGAWALLGIDGPGVYQPSSATPDFSEPFPIITVLSNGDPVYSPSKTVDQAATNVKRDAPLPTETVFFRTNRWKLLSKYMSTPKEKWPRNAGFALMPHIVNRFVGIPIPGHYAVIAGFIEYGRQSEVLWDDCDYKPEKVLVSLTLDWNATMWDLTAKKKNIRSNLIPLAQDWPDLADLADYDGEKVKFMGRIKDTATEEFIQTTALAIAKQMNDNGGYRLFWRNCRNYAYKLWNSIKY